MSPEIGWLLVSSLGVVAGMIGGVVGFGSNIILMPALVAMFGPFATVPIMAISAIMANATRVVLWWREIDWRANAAYCATAIPAAVLGANVLVHLDARLIEASLGTVLIAMIPARRWLLAQGLQVGLVTLAMAGAGIGFLTGIVATTGPINTPFFIAYGLTKGAFLGTEAFGSLAVSLTKIGVLKSLAALPTDTIVNGLLVGSSVMVGSWFAKGVVARMDASRFRLLMEVLSMAAGLTMLWSAMQR